MTIAHRYLLGYNYTMDRMAIKEEARRLRSRGKTYSEIMNTLGIKLPKSTMAEWCRGVKLPDSYWNKLDKINKYNYIKARKAAWLASKQKRERFLNELLKNNEILKNKIGDKDILKIILAILYLGEGAKWKGHHGLMLGSSEPDIINLYIRLLDICYGIKVNQLKCRISYRADQNLRILKKFWSKVTGIPLINFYKSKPDPRTIGKPTKNKGYKGVCVVTCGGTHIQLELEAIPKIILRACSSAVEHANGIRGVRGSNPLRSIR